MRVVVVHNRYSSRTPSGENLVVDDETRWLEEAGVEVHRFERSNDQLVEPSLVSRARRGVEVVWSVSAARDLARVLDAVTPDLVHVHNLFPLVSGSAPGIALRRKIPVVWTAHNRRLVCVGGSHFRDGAACHDCRPGQRLAGVRHGCFANSSSASALVTVATSLYGASARRRLTAIAVSQHLADWLTAEAGFARHRVRVKPNGVTGPPSGAGTPVAGGRHAFLFVGRLASYKGVSELLAAWARARPATAELRIVGDGALAAEVRAAAAADPTITWLGQVTPEEVSREMQNARAVVAPSMLDETFGRVAAEALAHGRPVITTGLGGLGEVVDESCGWLTGRDVSSLTAAIRHAAVSDDDVTVRGRNGRARYESRYSPVATTRRLIAIYEAAIAGHGSATTDGAPVR